jgi:extradiol dioxygenase family protein
MQIKGIFEIASRVQDLDRATNFYKDVLGFWHGRMDAERRWLFLWVNGRAGMVAL